MVILLFYRKFNVSLILCKLYLIAYFNLFNHLDSQNPTKILPRIGSKGEHMANPSNLV